jgi:hypothetical protein
MVEYDEHRHADNHLAVLRLRLASYSITALALATLSESVSLCIGILTHKSVIASTSFETPSSGLERTTEDSTDSTRTRERARGFRQTQPAQDR